MDSNLRYWAWRAGLRTLRWTAGLAVVSGAYGLGAYALGGGTAFVWRPISAIVGHVGLLLPFAAVTAGLSLHAANLSVQRRRHAVALVGGSVVLVSYLLLAFARPAVEYRVDAADGIDVASRHPFGPATPIALARQRAFIVENPPVSYSLSVEQPLATPPNWVAVQLHQPAAFALFAVLSILFGLFVGGLTSGLSPPARRQARWALALVGGIAFFIAAAIGDTWVRGSPSRSALLGVWLPLLVPLLEVLVLAWLARVRDRDGGQSGGVDGRH